VIKEERADLTIEKGARKRKEISHLTDRKVLQLNELRKRQFSASSHHKDLKHTPSLQAKERKGGREEKKKKRK